MVNGGIDATSVPTQTVGGPVDAHFPDSVSSNARVLLKGPSLVLGESFLDVSTMKQLKHLLATFHNFSYIFRFLQTSQIG